MSATDPTAMASGERGAADHPAATAEAGRRLMEAMDRFLAGLARSMRQTAADPALLTEFQERCGTSANGDDAAGLLRGMADLAEVGVGLPDESALIVLLTPEQATALYDLACWRLDDDMDHREIEALVPLNLDTLKSAATAIIDAGGGSHAYV